MAADCERRGDDAQPTKGDLLAMDYTELLRTTDVRVREAAWMHLNLRYTPLLPPYKLERHQLEMLQWIDEREANPYRGIRGGIVAAVMGLGKTLCATVLCVSRRRGRNPSLVVCSKTLMNSWKRDLTKFFGEVWVAKNVVFLHREYCKARGLQQMTRESIRKAEIVITAYPSCTSAHKALCDRLLTKEKSSHAGLDVLYDIEWNRVILDESQNIANPETAAFSACKALIADRRLALTGTPFKNVHEDVRAQLMYLGITPVPAKCAWDEVRFAEMGLDRVVLTMDYESAGITLPERNDFYVTVQLSAQERTAYRHVETRAQELYDELEKGLVKYECVLEILLRLRQFCLAPYLTTLSENCATAIEKMGEDIADSELASWLTDKAGSAGEQSAKTKALVTLLEGLGSEKVIVFSQFKGYIHLVADLLKRRSNRPVLVLDGGVKIKDRAEIERRFNEEDQPFVLLMNYRIGSEGLNLQEECNVAVFTDLAWNAAGMNQAARRVWRKGQKKQVQCYYLLVKDSVEERMTEICEDKSEAMSAYASSEGAKMDRRLAGQLIGRHRPGEGAVKEHDPSVDARRRA
jgi:SNF2 family DNA or RNA helicase